MNELTEINTQYKIEQSEDLIRGLILESANPDDLQGFKSLEVYGTIYDPLFKASDIGTILMIKNIYQNFKNLDENVDYIKKNNKTFVTEPGFYKLIFSSRTAFAKVFQNFVCKILKRLRIQGSISQKDMEEIRNELSISHSTNKQLHYKNEVLKYNNFRLTETVNIKPLCNHDVDELNILRQQVYTKYYVYKSANPESDNNIPFSACYNQGLVFDMDTLGDESDLPYQIELFINISCKLDQFTLLEVIYLNPTSGFANLQKLMTPYIKNKRSEYNINLSKTSPIYILDDIHEFYNTIEASRYLTSDDEIDNFSSDDEISNI